MGPTRRTEVERGGQKDRRNRREIEGGNESGN